MSEQNVLLAVKSRWVDRFTRSSVWCLVKESGHKTIPLISNPGPLHGVGVLVMGEHADILSRTAS